MTRDTIRVHGDRDSSDVEVYPALWAVAPFPRLPDDAPADLKKLTVDIEDPKRVYTIHKASRRHHFQLLVERFIFQIRYGCASPSCTTPTCFSCRRRLANGAPVRRYNSTSARTLAIHLAGLDNPEQALCHNSPAIRAVPVRRPSSPRMSSTTESHLPSHVGAVDTVSENHHNSPSLDGSNDRSDLHHAVRTPLVETVLRRKSNIDVSCKDEDVNTDHRSFVQNVVETVAYKMLEWLTPRSYHRFVQPRDVVQPEAPENSSKDLGRGDQRLQHATSMDDREKVVQQRSQPEDSNIDAHITSGKSHHHSRTTDTLHDSSHRTTSASKSKVDTIDDTKTSERPLPRSRPSLNNRRKSDIGDSQGLKSILNKVSRLSENEVSIAPAQRNKRKSLQHSLLGSPSIQVSEIPAPAKISVPSSAQSALGQASDRNVLEKYETRSNLTERPTSDETSKANKTCLNSPLQKQARLPQSLSCMTIEVIELLCDTLQLDRAREQHLLHPHNVSKSLKRRRTNVPTTYRLYPDVSTLEVPKWRGFIEQSFFDVLGRPRSLLISFCDEQHKLFDTHTLWYLMLRLTRAAPSLVFDALWITAGNLFRPPKTLEGSYEWAKGSDLASCSSEDAISNHEAAQTINICLHALIATAPLVFDSRQLANMSRIRSYGLTMLGREISSLEPMAMYLQYEDAFTNDLAMRLARRLFAAISTRRRFTELVELQRDATTEHKMEMDVLDNIMATLKFLDLGPPPILDFSGDEREVHEKRVPTLILDWARTIMLQDWRGTAEVPSDGSFGGALATIATIYKSRKALLFGDIHFRTEYFAERLDPIEMPLEWLSFRQNRRTAHLLDYPYLFNPATLVTYFRAINYSRMNESYEQARAKTNMVCSAMEENRLMTDKNRRDKLYERLRTSTTKFMVLDIRRTDVLLDTFNQIWRREERELLRPLKVRLGEESGEEGLDSGGVQQEFFRLAIAEALDPEYGTFTIDPRTKMTWFQPGSPEPLWKFELIGMLLSLSVYNGLTLPITFPAALYRKLLGEEVTELHHIADGWPDLANGLTALLDWDEKDGLVEDIFARTYEFSVEQFGQPISREMGKSVSPRWPQFPDQEILANPSDAPMVTNANRDSYVSDYVRWLTDISVAPQYEAFKKGFFSCLLPRSITLFDSKTLQSLIEGVQEIDISELRRATRYIGWDATHRTIRDFWSIVKKYDLEGKKRLLEFVTASDRVPVGGMKNVMFTIQKNGVGDGHLPSSYTCYGILLLPEFSEKEVLREKMQMALENSKGFGFA